MFSGNWNDELLDILNSARIQISDLGPSEWAELNRYMDSDVTDVPGLFSFYNSPYTREILEFFSQSHPGKIGAVMKGSQGGFSASIIENAIPWIIANDPGNILFLVGQAELVKDSVSKIDRVIEATGIKDLIQPSVTLKHNNKTGNTDSKKEFKGGYLMINTANHKMLRQLSIRYGLIDDFEAMKSETTESGDTFSMIENRFKAFKSNMKLMFISTPELKEKSNIEDAFMKGDQRYYFIPAPCCGQKIRLFWSCDSELNTSEKAGVTWKVDENNRLITESVGYICQKCGNFFDDSNKMNWINQGEWIPTANPSRPGYYSWHWSALLAPTFMYGWTEYIYQWMECHPLGLARIESKYKTFVNQVLGECYEPPTESISANKLQQNIRNYQIGVIPESLSISDGNGKIVLITCGIDMNGVEDDARIDYEIVAFSESGSTYSIDHGSIGTFIPKDPGIIDRERWTYRFGTDKTVWTELIRILKQKFKVDTGREMAIAMTCLDSGYLPKYPYAFVDFHTDINIVSVKGSPTSNFIQNGADKKTFIQSKEKSNLFLIESNLTKDKLAEMMKSDWLPEISHVQPPGFMNYPTPSDGKYLFSNYFQHFEAEHKVFDAKQEKYVWEKITPNHQNHLFDCRLYSYVAKDILLSKLFKKLKIIDGKWSDYVRIVVGKGQNAI